MRNLHQIGPILREIDKAIIWWHSTWGDNIAQKDGMLYYYNSYEKQWSILPKPTAYDEKFIIEQWKKSGSILVTISDLPADFKLGY